MQFGRRVFIVVCSVLLIAALHGAAVGATFVVTKTADTNDGVCDGDCSLREAINAANVGAGADIVTLPAGIYQLSLIGANEDGGVTGDLDIVNPLTINGASPQTTIIDGLKQDRIFDNSSIATINKVTLKNGSLTGNSGGDVITRATLTLNNVVLTAGFASAGGGLHINTGTATLNNCTVNNNVAINGGGIGTNPGVTLNVNNSTISGNRATFDAGGILGSGATINLRNVTLTLNVADSGATGNGDGGGFQGTTFNIRNSIIAGNIDRSAQSNDCSGTLNSQSHNLIGDLAGCTITGDTTGNITGVSPNLGGLTNNGGLTFTHAPLSTSLALNSGDNATCIANDQRGVTRPQSGVCDMGSVEDKLALIVSKTADTNDGVCNADCSLREAIGAANANADLDFIKVPAGTYNLSLAGVDNTNAAGDLDILQDVVITGAGPLNSIVVGTNADNVVEVRAGTVTLKNLGWKSGSTGINNLGTLTVDHCNITNNVKGGISNSLALNLLDSLVDSNGGTSSGINTTAGTTLTVLRSVISNNSGSGTGGVVASTNCSLTIDSSLISGNHSTAGNGGGVGFIGGNAAITNTTITGNTAVGGGGGVINQGNMILNNVTITGNTADSDNSGNETGGGLSNSGTTTILNTLIAGNTNNFGSGKDCSGFDIISGGHNLIQDPTGCTLTGDLSGNLIGTNPKLLPLSQNGGPTSSHGVLATSAAIDAGNNATCAATDQRSLARPQHASCDIGAFESVCRSWESRSNLGNANLSTVEFDPNTNGTVYSAAPGFVLKSIDHGLTFSSTTAGLPAFATVIQFAIDPTDPSIVYAASNVGVLKSTDAGSSWATFSTGITDTGLEAIVVNPQDSQTLYAASAAAHVFKSTNGGVGWIDSSTGVTGVVQAMAIDPLSPNVLYIGGTGGFQKSTDSGSTWQSKSAGMAGVVNVIALDPQNPGVLYAGTNGNGVFKSVNAAGVWSAINAGLGNLAIRGLQVEPDNPNILFASAVLGGTFRSADAGASWSRIQEGLEGLNIFNVAFDPFDTSTVWLIGNNALLSFTQQDLFCDEFEDGDASNWTILKGAWTVSAGNLVGTTAKKADIKSPQPPCSVCTIETDMSVGTGGRDSIFGWFQDNKNNVELRMFEDKNKWQLKQKFNGTVVAKLTINRTVDANVTYHVLLKYDGTQFSLFIDGVNVMHVSTSHAPSGAVNFRVKSTTGIAVNGVFKGVVVH